MSRVLIVATGRGGPVGGAFSAHGEADVRRVLVGGDLAQMALAALKGGAGEVVCVRVNQATPATLSLGNLQLTARNPGQAGDATLAKRYLEASGKTALELRNPVTGEHERYGALPDLETTVQAVNRGAVAYAAPLTGAPTLCNWHFFDGGDEGGADWEAALAVGANLVKADSASVGTADAAIINRAEGWLRCPLYVGAGAYATKGPLLHATYALAGRVSRARIVCNTVTEEDMQTHRAITMPAYHLAAFAAGLCAAGRDPGPVESPFPALGFILSEEDVAALSEKGVLPAPFDHLSETYRLLFR